MKKIFFLLAIMAPFIAWGTLDVTARASYYYPVDKDFRQIYGDGNVNWGLEIDVPIWCNFDAFVGVDYFTVTGRSTLFHYHTRFTMVPVSLGLQYNYDFTECFSAYGAIGGVYTPVIMKDDSPFVVQHRNRGGFGVIGRLGAKIHLYECLFLDVFGDYTWQELSYKGSDRPFVTGRHVDLSHLKVGGGLTYKF